jgi:hypothetical protein
MNYSKIYNNLIQDAKDNPKSDLYKETHHIIPKCMFGDDSLNNLVELTARQHYLAHWLLYKIYKTKELAHAWHCMSVIGIGQKERSINSHLFEYCKKERNRILSEEYSGSGNNFFGKNHTEETKIKLSKIHSGKCYKTPEQIKEWVNSVAKRKKTTEHKSKIGRKGLVMLQNIYTKEIVRVPFDDSRCDDYAWVNPRKLSPEIKYKCEYCEIITTPSNLTRWHNENCKRKPKL